MAIADQSSVIYSPHPIPFQEVVAKSPSPRVRTME